MGESKILEIASNALILALQLSAPVVLAVVIVGLLVSLFQAATQLQEQSLGTALKIVVVYAVLIVLGSWMFSALCSFCTSQLRFIASVH